MSSAVNSNVNSKSFICPKCGGEQFGSRVLPDKSLYRYCNGNPQQGIICNFGFHQIDDVKYFTGDIGNYTQGGL
jgi:hypothetical protein